MNQAFRNTTTGTVFEAETPIDKIFSLIANDSVMFAKDGPSAKATGLKNWLKTANNLPGVKYIGTGTGKHPDFWSKNYIPDGVIIYKNTLFIIEKKFQKCTGTADAKLSEGGFRLNRFEQLKNYLPYSIKNVKYLYILGEWFKDEKYRDRLEYERANNPKVEFMFYDEEPPYEFFGVE